jgi:outer membrane receptor protein involved in Fe transport
LATSALAGAGALLVSQPAHAQSQPPQPGSPPPPLPAAQAAPNTSAQVGEVVVTAQRRNESLSRVGETVNAVGASELARQGITSPQDLTKDVPGLQATTSYGGNPVYTLRGVGFSTQNVNATAPVGIYVDEASVPYPYMSNGVLFDLQRVEVLKGPQGTLYGRNATGGLIDFVTAKPTDHFAAGGSAEAGNYSTFNFTGYISGPVNDWLRLRLAGSSDNRFEGWQESVTRDEHLGKLFRDAVRLTADIGNGGPFSAEVTATYWRQTGDTLATQAIYFRPAGSPFATPAEYASVKHGYAAVNLTSLRLC